MDTAEFVDTRTRRCMARALNEFEAKIERPLRALAGAESITPAQVRVLLADLELVKRAFRRGTLTLGADCLDLMPDDLQINGFEPLSRRSI